MNPVVLDTNVVVSALLVPTGTQAVIVSLALRGQFALYAPPTAISRLRLERPEASHQIEHRTLVLASAPITLPVPQLSAEEGSPGLPCNEDHVKRLTWSPQRELIIGDPECRRFHRGGRAGDGLFLNVRSPCAGDCF
jgi:hypothetical protein